jgi:hypothetical protein
MHHIMPQPQQHSPVPQEMNQDPYTTRLIRLLQGIQGEIGQGKPLAPAPVLAGQDGFRNGSGCGCPFVLFP